MDSSDDELERPFLLSNTTTNNNNKKKSTNKNKKWNNKKNKNTTTSYNNKYNDDDDDDDDDDSDEVSIQCAILSSLRTLEQEKDKKQKRPMQPCTLKVMDNKKINLKNMLFGSMSSPIMCVICHDVVPNGTPGISPCGHVACSDCLSRYVGEQVNFDVRQVACPGENCDSVLKMRDYAGLVPDEVFQRWFRAWCEGSVLEYTLRFTCPFEGCGSRIVDDERRYRIRACTCCWRLFCFNCRSACHMGMSCNQFKKREAEALGRRMLIIRRREEEESERKRKRWCKENNLSEEEEEILRLVSRITAHFPEFGNELKSLMVFNPLSSDTE